MNFSEILALMRPDQGRWTVSVPESWLQGRSIYGGLQSAIALRAMRSVVPAGLPLRVLQTTFVAPVSGAVSVRAELLRTGKSAVHAEARLLDGDRTAALVVAVFGASRPSSVVVTPQQRPVPVPEGAIVLPFIEGLSPAFVQHFSMRWLRGGLPFTASKLAEAVLEVGMKDPGPMTEEHLVAIADAPPPVALSMLETRAPGSSLTWTLEILGDRLERLPVQGYRLDAEVTAARDGYTSQSVMVWAPDGTPAALSRQSMVVFG